MILMNKYSTLETVFRQMCSSRANWNSVFTYTLLFGLQDKKVDLDGNGEIRVSELQNYLSTEVPKLTNNHQRLTMRLQNITNDWRVW